MERLVQHYRKLRENDVGAGGKSAYRMTVRQLESMIRLSEARARLHCDKEVQAAHIALLGLRVPVSSRLGFQVRPEYVEEAARLLKKSLIHVETEKIVLDDIPSHINDRQLVASENTAKTTTTATKPNGSTSASNKGKKTPRPDPEEKTGADSEEALVVSYEDYKRISAMLVSHLRDHETSEEDEGAHRHHCLRLAFHCISMLTFFLIIIIMLMILQAWCSVRIW